LFCVGIPGRFVRVSTDEARKHASRKEIENMDLQEKKPRVLARIPKIVSSVQGQAREETPLSSGRLIGQALSFKLLGGAALVLVVVAIFAFHGSSPSSVPSVAVTPPPAWQPSPPAASAEAAPVWVAPVATAPASTPAPASPLPMPEVRPQPKLAGTPPAPPAAALMSAWPSPAHPTSAPEMSREEPQVGVNQAMAIRSPEYLGNSHDNTRSGVR
jgi:hypothetical protein